MGFYWLLKILQREDKTFWSMCSTTSELLEVSGLWVQGFKLLTSLPAFKAWAECWEEQKHRSWERAAGRSCFLKTGRHLRRCKQSDTNVASSRLCVAETRHPSEANRNEFALPAISLFLYAVARALLPTLKRGSACRGSFADFLASATARPSPGLKGQATLDLLGTTHLVWLPISVATE